MNDTKIESMNDVSWGVKGSKMDYAKSAKSKGLKLDLSAFRARNCWRKYHAGKMHYFVHPLTKEGYGIALQEWYLLKAQIDASRPNAKVYHHHIELFQQVLTYWEKFGTPTTERQLKHQVTGFIAFLRECLNQPVLPELVPYSEFLRPRESYAEFRVEFVGRFSGLGLPDYSLPAKWQDRVDKMHSVATEKKPQTIHYWYEAYLSRMNEKVGSSIIKKSADNRRYTLSDFHKYCDTQQHITSLGDDFLKKYFSHVDKLKVARKSKFQYFKSVRMFIRWCSRDPHCDLTEPTLLDSKDFVFREHDGTGRKRLEKKKLLWTPEEFNTPLPDAYRCYLLMMLNCGFRHVDLDNLQHSDIDWQNGRIIIQRNKLNQLDTAPVISYKLWDSTLNALEQQKSDDPKYVFGNVGNKIQCWWKDNRESHGLKGKRLDYLRKTGATAVDEYELGLSDFYLGESLSRTSQIHYSFTDGEPNAKLDRAIQYLGAKFGQASQPTQTIELTGEVITALKKLNVIL